jgi:hypothetical protein
MWIAGGANWFFGRAPEHWNPWLQLMLAGMSGFVPGLITDLRFQATATVEPTPIQNLTEEDYVLAVATG